MTKCLSVILILQWGQKKSMKLLKIFSYNIFSCALSFYFTALGIEQINWRGQFTKGDVILSWLSKWCLIYKCNGGTKTQILLGKKMKSPGNNALKQIQFRKQFKSYCLQFAWLKRIVDSIQTVCVQLNLALVEGIVYP